MEDMTKFKSKWVKVESFLEKRNGHRFWVCKCRCGKEIFLNTYQIRHEQPKSCGCYVQIRKGNYSYHKAPIKHGLTKHALHPVWKAMKQRCYNTNDKRYHVYGGKGITVCDDWKNDFKKFYDWAIEHNWVKGLCIDRIDHNKGYCPENCQFLTLKESSRKVSIDNPGLHKGIKNFNALLTEDEVCEIKKMFNSGYTSKVISEKMKIPKRRLDSIKYNATWKHLGLIVSKPRPTKMAPSKMRSKPV